MKPHRIQVALFIVLAAAAGCEKSKDGKSEPAASSGDRAGASVAPAAGAESWIELPGKDVVEPLKAQAAIAAKAGRTPYLYLHADWCQPCLEIEKTRGTDPRMKAAFAGTHIIAVDVDAADPAQLAQLGIKVEVVPIFHRVRPDGTLTGESIDGGAWGDNIPANMAPPLTAFFSQKK